MRISNTTLRFIDPLGLIELSKTVTLVITVYYSERIRIKILKGKRLIGQSPGETRCKLLVLSQQSRVDDTYFSQQ